MIRRKFILSTALAAAATFAHRAWAAIGDATVGTLSAAEFERANLDGAKLVAAVAPTTGTFSEADALLLAELATGGMNQLLLSQLAVQMATAPDVKLLAQAEVAEQTGLKAKLQQIVENKNTVLPGGPDDRTLTLATQMKALSGTEFDRAYLREGGVKGHQTLDAVMTKVRNQASDPVLKSVEAAAHPLVLVHLAAAQAELEGAA